jgi:hypothetical protein
MGNQKNKFLTTTEKVMFCDEHRVARKATMVEATRYDLPTKFKILLIYYYYIFSHSLGMACRIFRIVYI